MPYSFLTLCVQSRTLPWSLPPWTPHALHDRGTRDSQVRRCHLGALCVHSPCGQRTGGSLGGALGASQGSLFPVIGFSRDVPRETLEKGMSCFGWGTPLTLCCAYVWALKTLVHSCRAQPSRLLHRQLTHPISPARRTTTEKESLPWLVWLGWLGCHPVTEGLWVWSRVGAPMRANLTDVSVTSTVLSLSFPL